MKKRWLAMVLVAGLVIGPVGPMETVRADYTVEVPDPWINEAGFKFHIRSDQQTDRSRYYVAGDEVPHFDSIIQGRISDGDGDWFFPVAYIEPRRDIINEVGMVTGTTHPIYHLTTKIYDEAFKGRNDVKKITVPPNVDTIGAGAFRNCSNLTEVVIHAGAFGITIEEGAFYGCSSLERITITGSGNVSINGRATLEENAQDIKIEGSAFEGCDNLTSFTIVGDGSPRSIEIGDSAFLGCGNLTTVALPDKVTSGSIGKLAFAYCDNLTEITIPGGVGTIGYGAFMQCTKLISVEMLNGVTDIGRMAFGNPGGGECALESVTIPDTVTDIGDEAFVNQRGLTSITIPDGVSRIGVSVFQGCGLTEITIPGSVESIGDEAFRGCPLTDVTIPDGVKSIGSQAFSSCSLTNITIPDSVESIGALAFANNELTSIVIPENVSHIGANPVASYWDLQEILLDEKNVYYTLEDGILYDKDKTRLISCPSDKTGSITIPDSVMEIGDYAFDRCSELEEIIIPDSVERIGELAFAGCGRLTSITIPEHVAEIGESGAYGVGGTAFEICCNLLTITVDEKNEAYSSEDGILYDKDKTRLIACPNGKTGNLAIPQTVTTISEHAFYGSALTVIALPDTMESISSIFCYNNHLFGIIIPDSVTDIDAEIFMGCENLTIYGNEGSFAETYAQENGIPFSTGTPLYFCEITVTPSSVSYTGKEQTPSVVVKDGDKTLTEGTDYTIRYKDNCDVGTAYVILTGKGEYAGTVQKEFVIMGVMDAADGDWGAPNGGIKDPDKEIGMPGSETSTQNPVQKKDQTLTGTKTYNKAYGNKAFRLNITRKTGNGKLSYKTSNKKVVTVDQKGRVTIKGTGIATITVTAAETSSYKEASVKITVKVAPAKQVVKSVKTAKGRKLTVKWKKDSKASGYQIQYSTDRKFKKGIKTVWVSKYSTSSKVIKKLAAGKKYYVRVCAYKNIKVNGKTQKLCGAWSTAVRSDSIRK